MTVPLNPPKSPNIVESVFGRKPKKHYTSLFESKSAPSAGVAGKKKKMFSGFSKKLPFGLEIGTSAIKLVQLERDPQGLPRIAAQEIVELPKEIQTEKSRARQDLVKPILRDLIEKKNLPEGCCVTAPWMLLKTHFIKLPRLSEEEGEDAIRLEVRRQHQLPIEDVSFDRIFLKRQQKYFGDQSGVLLVSVPKKPIFDFLSLFEELDIYPVAIETESLAQTAALNYFKMLEPEGVVILVDVGAAKTTLNVICNQELLFVRMVPANGLALTEGIAENCHVSWLAAEAMKKAVIVKRQEAVPASESAQQREGYVHEALSSFREHLVRDIEHTFKYFAFEVMHSPDLAFRKIILCGGGALLPDLAGSLREHFNVPVELFGTNLFPGSQGSSVLKKEEWDVRSITALGLALRGFES